MARLGIGLIGVGKHGSRYARHLCEGVSDLQLVGLARRDLTLARQQAMEFRCRAYADYRELIAAPDVDAILAVVPPTLHPEIVEAAAAYGRAVLVEKPAATSLEEGRRMRRAAHKAGIPVMVAQTLRYNSVVRTLIEARSRIGFLHALRLNQCFEPSRPGWIDDPRIAGGGVILHTGVHSFDLVRVLSGLEAERVSCEMAAVGTMRTEDNFSAAIRLRADAVLASVTGSRATASRSGGIDLVGDQGQLIADHVRGTVHLLQGTVANALPVAPAVPTVQEVLRDFCGALRRGEQPPIPLDEGLRAVAIAQACYKSARAHQAIEVEEP